MKFGAKKLNETTELKRICHSAFSECSLLYLVSINCTDMLLLVFSFLFDVDYLMPLITRFYSPFLRHTVTILHSRSLIIVRTQQIHSFACNYV